MFTSPLDGSSLTVTPNQSVPLKMTIQNNDIGLLGHWANYLFPARGTIECMSANTIAGLGLRFIGTNAFSSLLVVTE